MRTFEKLEKSFILTAEDRLILGTHFYNVCSIAEELVALEQVQEKTHSLKQAMINELPTGRTRLQ